MDAARERVVEISTEAQKEGLGFHLETKPILPRPQTYVLMPLAIISMTRTLNVCAGLVRTSLLLLPS